MPTDEHTTESEPDGPTPLVGRWQRTDADAATGRYPVELDMSTGTFRGRRGEQQGMIWWDAGIYRFADPTHLVLSTATDELVTYRVRLDGDRLEIETPDEGPVVYQRAGDSPSD